MIATGSGLSESDGMGPDEEKGLCWLMIVVRIDEEKVNRVGEMEGE